MIGKDFAMPSRLQTKYAQTKSRPPSAKASLSKAYFQYVAFMLHTISCSVITRPLLNVARDAIA
jgi:hypothetical protein